MIKESPSGYVGTYKKEGVEQLKILKDEGLKPNNTVLEVGCGCLHAGIPIIKYLNKNNYTGIEPNKWLWEDIKLPKKATILDNSDFTAPGEYDYLISHSVLSHASTYQVKLFLRLCQRVKKSFCSLHFAWNGQPIDWAEWQYPGVTFHAYEHIENWADSLGLSIKLRPDIKERIIKTHSSSTHDWIEIT